MLGRRAQVQILGRKAGADPGDFFLNEMHDHWKIPDRQMQPLGRLLWVATLSRVLAAKMDQ